jgi:hypothetical protein
LSAQFGFNHLQVRPREGEALQHYTKRPVRATCIATRSAQIRNDVLLTGNAILGSDDVLFSEDVVLGAVLVGKVICHAVM